MSNPLRYMDARRPVGPSLGAVDDRENVADQPPRRGDAENVLGRPRVTHDPPVDEPGTVVGGTPAGDASERKGLAGKLRFPGKTSAAADADNASERKGLAGKLRFPGGRY
jgi:hypothetical protein